MKEQIQLLIAQHKLHKEEAVYELNMLSGYKQDLTLSKTNIKMLNDIEKEIEMTTLFICELEELLSF